jgi:DNA-binding transcriptional LysR family regulator
MHLATLKLFCDIIRLRSFSKGAKAHQVTQSAASQAIQQLEEELGVTLIDRGKRPFAITPGGQKYYDGVRAMLSEYSRIEAEIKQITAGVAGTVRVAAIYSVGLYDFGRHMRRFMTEYPLTTVRLEYLRPNKIHDAVVDEQADIGIMSYPHADRIVTVLPWRSEKMVFVCHPTHRLAASPLIRAPDLEGENFVGFDADLPIRKAIDRSLKQQHTRVSIVMEFDNIETIKQAIEVGAGVAILPEPTVRREAESKRLVSIPLAMPELVRPVGIIHRRNRPLSAAVRRFIALLKEAESATPPAQSPDERLLVRADG